MSDFSPEIHQHDRSSRLHRHGLPIGRSCVKTTMQWGIQSVAQNFQTILASWLQINRTIILHEKKSCSFKCKATPGHCEHNLYKYIILKNISYNHNLDEPRVQNFVPNNLRVCLEFFKKKYMYNVNDYSVKNPEAHYWPSENKWYPKKVYLKQYNRKSITLAHSSKK